MKKVLFVLFVLWVTTLYPQNNWIWQNPLPQGNHLNDVCFVSSSVGYAVGDNGTILKTTNAGTNWILQQSGTSLNLHGVVFTDANTGTTVGSGGIILRTTNGGLNWISQNSGLTKPLYSVSFTDVNTGTVVGTDVILRTTNGGITWVTQYENNSYHYEAVSFIDHNYGMAVGYNADLGDAGIIHKTTNGGTTWTGIGAGFLSLIFDVAMLNSNTAVVVGEHNLIIRTTDGGSSWESKSPVPNNFALFRSVSFSDVNNGVIIGRDGNEKIFLRTTNGGVSWDLQTIDASNLLTAVSVVDVNRCTIVGEGGVILRSENSSNWTNQSYGSSNNINDVSFLNSSFGIAVGSEGTILKTTNQGTVWSTQSSGTINSLFAGQLVDASRGYSAGANGTILKTTNAGTTWVELTSGTGEWLYGIFFSTADRGIIAGTQGVILKTTNGGTTWTKPVSGTFWDLHSVSFADAENGIIVGKNGTILKTTNGGESWLSQTSGTTKNLYGISFINANQAIAVGESGTILKTTNGGNTWVLIPVSGTIVSLFDVSFSDPDNGTAVGIINEAGWSYGLILRTTNSGSSWSVQPSGTTNTLNAVHFTDFNNGTVAGFYGTILRTTNSGGIPVELLSFNASIEKNDIILTWVTATETNNRGFEIERKTPDEEFHVIGFVEGNGTTSEPQSYNYMDEDVSPGNYTYRLRQIDFDGTFSHSEEVSVSFSDLPAVYSMHQNYPNPFNPVTVINYTVPVQSLVIISVYDALGREIKTLLNEEKSPGTYTIQFSSEGLSSGIYFYRMQAGEFLQTNKMILIR